MVSSTAIPKQTDEMRIVLTSIGKFRMFIIPNPKIGGTIFGIIESRPSFIDLKIKTINNETRKTASDMETIKVSTIIWSSLETRDAFPVTLAAKPNLSAPLFIIFILLTP